MNRTVAVVQEHDPAPMRVDRYICEVLGILSRSQLRSRVAERAVNDRPAKASRMVHPGDRIVLLYDEPPEPDIQPENVPLDIVFENASVVVVNKPQGMVVHPAAGNHTGTLVHGLLYHCANLAEAFTDDAVRPGIVHRLDKDTSGVMIAAKNAEAKEYLARQFRRKTVIKKYFALAKGMPRPRLGTIVAPVGRHPRHRKKIVVEAPHAKAAETRYKVLSAYGEYSFLSLRPMTGRTHQIRVHLQSVGCPVLGDPLYARRDGRFPEATLMLHAYSLSIELPGEETMSVFRAPLPDRMRSILREAAGR